MSKTNVLITEKWLKGKLGKEGFRRLKDNPRSIFVDDLVIDYTTIGARWHNVNFYIRKRKKPKLLSHYEL